MSELVESDKDDKADKVNKADEPKSVSAVGKDSVELQEVEEQESSGTNVTKGPVMTNKDYVPPSSVENSELSEKPDQLAASTPTSSEQFIPLTQARVIELAEPLGGIVEGDESTWAGLQSQFETQTAFQQESGGGENEAAQKQTQKEHSQQVFAQREQTQEQTRVQGSVELPGKDQQDAAKQLVIVIPKLLFDDAKVDDDDAQADDGDAQAAVDSKDAVCVDVDVDDGAATEAVQHTPQLPQGGGPSNSLPQSQPQPQPQPPLLQQQQQQQQPLSLGFLVSQMGQQPIQFLRTPIVDEGPQCHEFIKIVKTQWAFWRSQIVDPLFKNCSGDNLNEARSLSFRAQTCLLQQSGFSSFQPNMPAEEVCAYSGFLKLLLTRNRKDFLSWTLNQAQLSDTPPEWAKSFMSLEITIWQVVHLLQKLEGSRLHGFCRLECFGERPCKKEACADIKCSVSMMIW